MVSRRLGHEAIELIHYCGPISLETQNIGSDELVYVVKINTDDRFYLILRARSRKSCRLRAEPPTFTASWLVSDRL